MRDAGWTIDELASRVAGVLAADGYPGAPNGRVRGVPDARAIRWYATIGLVDRPAGMRGRTALYGVRHLLQLVAVKRRQAEGRSIADIQAELAGASDAALRAVAGLPDALPQPPTPPTHLTPPVPPAPPSPPFHSNAPTTPIHRIPPAPPTELAEPVASTESAEAVAPAPPTESAEAVAPAPPVGPAEPLAPAEPVAAAASSAPAPASAPASTGRAARFWAGSAGGKLGEVDIDGAVESEGAAGAVGAVGAGGATESGGATGALGAGGATGVGGATGAGGALFAGDRDSVGVLTGIPLAGGAILLLPTVPDHQDLSAIAAAARPLLDLLTAKGLLRSAP